MPKKSTPLYRSEQLVDNSIATRRLVRDAERDKGFEPSPPAWKAGMLAVEHQSRIFKIEP